MTTVEQRKEMREFADNMGSDISVYSIQYQLAKMVWTLVDELNAVSAKLDVVPEYTIDYGDELLNGIKGTPTFDEWYAKRPQAVQP